MSEQSLTPADRFSKTSRIVLSCGLAMVMLNRFEPAMQVADKVRCVLPEVHHDGASKDLEHVQTIRQSLKTERTGITIVLRETAARDQAGQEIRLED